MAANAAGRAHHPAADAINPSQRVRQPGDTARELACRGWYVFPCLPGDKRPAVDRWEQRACADPEKVARFWPGPRHNVGVACGPSGLVVIDLDATTHGELPDSWRLPGINDGRDVLAQLCEWAARPWPSTYTVATPAGGWHCYYRAPAGHQIRNNAGKLGPLIDVRARGGYVIGIGSVVGGIAYELIDGRSPIPMPDWLTRLLIPRQPASAIGTPAACAAPRRIAGLTRAVESAAQGERNSTLHWAACRVAEMIAAGEITEPDTTAALLTAAITAGLPEREATRTINSALRGGAR